MSDIQEPVFQIIYWPIRNPVKKYWITDDSMNQPKFNFTMEEAIQRCEDLEDPLWVHAIVDAPEAEEWKEMTSLRLIAVYWPKPDKFSNAMDKYLADKLNFIFE